MNLRSFALRTATLAAVAFAPGAALAIGHGTPDQSPPADESVCDQAGVRGAAYGLCVAYCEANDCDQFPDKESCSRLRDNYAKITGDESFPCDEVTPPLR
ncbi:MAG TPA: hypothetical protein VMW19_19215 [Myxococcota bacterium]|nr:hypothetical protein [Myxococcota bacterium]